MGFKVSPRSGGRAARTHLPVTAKQHGPRRVRSTTPPSGHDRRPQHSRSCGPGLRWVPRVPRARSMCSRQPPCAWRSIADEVLRHPDKKAKETPGEACQGAMPRLLPNSGNAFRHAPSAVRMVVGPGHLRPLTDSKGLLYSSSAVMASTPESPAQAVLHSCMRGSWRRQEFPTPPAGIVAGWNDILHPLRPPSLGEEVLVGFQDFGPQLGPACWVRAYPDPMMLDGKWPIMPAV